jgi:hypothetical protein
VGTAGQRPDGDRRGLPRIARRQRREDRQPRPRHARERPVDAVGQLP